MKKILLGLLALLGTARAFTLQNEPASNITRTTATLAATLGDVGTSNPVMTIYHGPFDGGTNATNWSYAAALGAQTNGTATVAVSNLTPASAWYHRAYAADASNALWAAATSNFFTLAGAPTNAPALTGDRGVMVDTNHVLRTPTAAQLLAANPTLGGGLTAGQVITNGLPLSNNITLFGGALGGTNGVYFSKGTNSYWILFP
jgi:hypothetical protein